jgi:hypothetical protein
MAFQDARVPTRIVTASSVGSINAASFATHADGLVGKVVAARINRSVLAISEKTRLT